MKFAEALLEAAKTNSYIYDQACSGTPLRKFRWDKPGQDVLMQGSQSIYWTRRGLECLQPWDIVVSDLWRIGHEI